MLQKVMRVYPAMLRVRLNIDQLLGAAVVDQRLTDLDGMLKNAQLDDNVPLVFMVTFIHASRRNVSERTEWAAKLASVAAHDRVLLAYARQFLPADQTNSAAAPATRPSSATSKPGQK